MIEPLGGPPAGLRDDRGSVTIVAAGLTLLACVLCLATVDVGRAVGARGRAQTAADAAALAAAQAIAIPSEEQPSDAAARLASANGASLTSCACDEGSSEATVVVAVTASFVLLGPDRTVTARARAVVGP
jgi:secretion/DNA translocation related TadE-like protein